MSKHNNYLILIAGGSASGKTTVAKKISDLIPDHSVEVINMDSYYRDLSHLSLKERQQANFDHPDSIDMDLLVQDITKLLNNKTIEQPTYDFVTYTRNVDKKTITPKKVIILDGLFCLFDTRLKKLADLKLFIKTDDDIRFIRRLQRDVIERKRTQESVINQYLKTVKPMHDIFIDPSRKDADIVIPWEFKNQVAIDMIGSHIEKFINRGK